MSNIDKLVQQRNDFGDKESRMIIDNLVFRQKEIGEIDEMKRTKGWKLLEKKIKENLRSKILQLTKDDPEIITLLALLSTTNVKNLNEILQIEVDTLLEES